MGLKLIFKDFLSTKYPQTDLRWMWILKWHTFTSITTAEISLKTNYTVSIFWDWKTKTEKKYKKGKWKINRLKKTVKYIDSKISNLSSLQVDLLISWSMYSNGSFTTSLTLE